MSDLGIYELQDSVWDEFGESDDHIVPHPADESGVQNGSHKKLKLEVSSISDNANRPTNFVALGQREDSSLILTKRDKMLENGSWSHADDGGFPSYDGDSVKGTATMAYDDSRTSDHCFESGTTSELCPTDAVFGGRLASDDNNLYNYSLNHTSQTESSLNFFDNEEKEGNDLYYEWPDIGNFEDVDKMFRSCDSTFGLGSLSNDDDFGWFSPSHAIEGSEDALKSGFQFSCSEPIELRSVSENRRESGPDGVDLSVNDSKMNLHRKQLKLQHPSDGKMNDRSLEDGDSFQHYNISEHTMDAETLSGNKVHQVISPVNPTKHKHDGRSNSFANEQMHGYISEDYHHHVGQKSEYATLSTIKCENNGQLSPSTKESSYASNQVQPTHRSSEAPIARDVGRASFHNNQHLQGHNFGSLSGMSSAAISDPVAVLKQVHRTGNDIDGHSEVDGSTGVKKELDSSLTQDSSSVSSVLGEMSLEATSFRQLQQVMEQLDIKTKLCIRDSLYRLARSAEQRHCANPNFASNGAATVEESNKCNGFMDMETGTNPIDRSVAHLLFHRPSYPSLVPGSNDASSPKSSAMIHRSVTSTPPTVDERENRAEEASADPEKKAS